jgi:hypothetical protein
MGIVGGIVQGGLYDLLFAVTWPCTNPIFCIERCTTNTTRHKEVRAAEIVRLGLVEVLRLVFDRCSESLRCAPICSAHLQLQVITFLI